MTVQLNWPVEVVDRLTAEARQRGLSLDAYLLRAVLEQRDSGRVDTDEIGRQRRREEAGRSIRDLRKDNCLGSDLTIRDLVEEGRRF
jgi:hypothetical protein